MLWKTQPGERVCWVCSLFVSPRSPSVFATEASGGENLNLVRRISASWRSTRVATATSQWTGKAWTIHESCFCMVWPKQCRQAIVPFRGREKTLKRRDLRCSSFRGIYSFEKKIASFITLLMDPEELSALIHCFMLMTQQQMLYSRGEWICYSCRVKRRNKAEMCACRPPYIPYIGGIGQFTDTLTSFWSMN